MKKTFVFTIHKDVDRSTYSVLRRAIHGQFEWAYVHEIGIREKSDLSVSRHDGRPLTLNERACLRIFVAGALAALSRIYWVCQE